MLRDYLNGRELPWGLLSPARQCLKEQRVSRAPKGACGCGMHPSRVAWVAPLWLCSHLPSPRHWAVAGAVGWWSLGISNHGKLADNWGKY